MGMSVRFAVVLGVLLVSGCGQPPVVQQTRSSALMSPAVSVMAILPEGAAAPTGQAALTGTPRVFVDNSPMAYRGGHVMADPINLYYIFYGDWSQEAQAISVLENFGQNIGNSPYFAINTAYTNSCNVEVSTSVNLAGLDFVQGLQNTNINVQQIVSDAITGGAFPADPNGVYFVLGAANVTEGSFCSVYCGYHYFMDVDSVRIQYSFVGNPRTQCPSGCAAFGVTTFPNELGADAMANVMAHELAETATDSWIDAWIDLDGDETGDKSRPA